MTVAPYGTWKSPITADLAVENSVRPAWPTAVGEWVYWVESRPSEGGRYVLVRRGAGGEASDVLPERCSVRTLVHEYGGRCHLVDGETVYFVDMADQRIYRAASGSEPVAVTPEPPAPRAWRYADLVLVPGGRHLVAVRERHEDGIVVNDIAAVPLDGSGDAVQLAGGHDFFLWPTLDAGGRRMAWVGWDHPNMPWDGTVLYEAELGDNLVPVSARVVAGGGTESVVEPRYAPDGRLHYVSDRTGWWNLYVDDSRGGEPLAPMEAEFAQPAWQCGQRGYGFRPDGTVVARWSALGEDHLGVVADGKVTEIPTPFTHLRSLDVAPDRVVVAGGSGALQMRIASIDLGTGEVTEVDAAPTSSVDDAYISVPEAVEVPTSGGLTAHAFYYAPRNPDFEAPAGEAPPLIVASHGGPTGATYALRDYGIQYWTSRGFAYVDVNYGGSTGYGRDYRNRLRGNWGIVDLDDCVNAALALAERGLADRRRLLVHGGSAGGYTTLCAVTFRDVFAAGASYYGVADAGALARETHKFESRYLDGLIGPWPDAQALYEERSPLFHTDLLRTPLILFQGLEDQVVPPAQAETMAAALREKGVPFAYVPFEGEQHGFRRAENIKRTAEAELYFYGQVLGFEPADKIEPVVIENAGALSGERGGAGGA
jgi:dipeptidyl aminopeptidase/acylaminoacyl peptidase